MAFDLKTLVCSVNIANGQFKTSRDKEFSMELYDRHSLQSMLEEASGLMGEKVPKTTKNMATAYISTLTVLVENSTDEWVSTFIYGFNHPETFTLCVRCLRTIAKLAEVKPFAEREYTVYEKADFEGVAERTVHVLTLLKTLLKRMIFVGESRKELDHKNACLQVCFSSIHILSGHIEQNLWTDEASQRCSRECIDLLLDKFKTPSVCKLLSLDTKHVLPAVENDPDHDTAAKKTVFGKLLINWRPNLQRNSWKLNPVTAASFCWCVKQMEFPHLGHYIELILPPVLLFIDDHMEENKANGTHCLIHMLKNTGAEELRWHGRAEVVYSALKQQLLTTEDSLLLLTHDAILLTLKVLVRTGNDLGVTTKYDEVFMILLQAASHENKLALRRIHTNPLHIFIEELGINSVKYTKLLLEIFEEYLDISDAPSEKARINILLAMKSFIKVAYPRIANHSQSLLKMMVKLLHEVTSKKLNIEENVEKQMIGECKECIELLKTVDESVVSARANLDAQGLTENGQNPE